ncbi:digestive cysteine proteinase 1-like [Aplysia californica]|uniref:Digestive cysteine proteinase 1-like n=1 Tax=Aplysia californica TaxID=6500 RepID=A0ABM1VRX9_APLCA|nr:digestive cysteine proteinase 1-like [Aplysia californica]
MVIMVVMIKLAIFALSVAVASANTDANWLIFKAKYNKEYSCRLEKQSSVTVSIKSSFLEEGQVVGSVGNYGCGGGFEVRAFQYVIDNKGIDTEESYPYKPEDRPCHFKRAGVGATAQAYVNVTSGSEDALQKAVAEVGPISVAIDASHPSFQQYSGGVYDELGCSTTDLDHAVLAVGYGTQDGKDYWIVKNSWTTSWGMDGYILMSRNKDNQCGIATDANYPTGVN